VGRSEIERLGALSAVGGKGGFVGTNPSGGSGSDGRIHIEGLRGTQNYLDATAVKP
jgi:hypothetical protein